MEGKNKKFLVHKGNIKDLECYLKEILDKIDNPAGLNEDQVVAIIEKVLSDEFVFVDGELTINQIDWSKIINIPLSLGTINRLAKFIVGAVGEMPDGGTTYSHPLLQNKTEAELIVFVDGEEVYADLSDEFSYSITGQQITFSAPLLAGTKVKLYTIPSPVSPVPPTLSNIYYGAKSAAGNPTPLEILAGSVTSQNVAGNLSINFAPIASVPAYYWIAVPKIIGSLKATWFANNFSQGTIGVPGSLIHAPVDITVGGQEFRVYVTDYPTIFVTPGILQLL